VSEPRYPRSAASAPRPGAKRRSTFYVALQENSAAQTPKSSPSKKLSNSSQTLSVVEPEKPAPRRTSSSKSPSKSPSVRIVPKQSPVHAPQPSPKVPKKSSSLLQLPSAKRSPSAKPTVLVASTPTVETKRVPVVVVEQHDGDTAQLRKETTEDEAAVHS
ncbi:hypothetical protein L9F63_008571, partial [Diploptera punctata]